VRRLAVNRWIRTSGAFDTIIDFDRVIADPSRSEAIAALYDSGDHLHPNDAGYRVMGEAVELKLFQ
jgi:lysophospholipase L1-like esterase